MAIIYTYPVKATLALADKILISDSADANKTKNATVTSIKDAINVVDSITATSPLVASASTGAITLSIPAATSSVNGYLTSTNWSTFNNKQSELQSGTNIKTINSNSILGSGDLVISGSGVTIFDDGSGVGLNIDKFDFIGNGVSAAVDGVDNTKINITIPGGAGNPGGTANNQVQYKNGTAFAATDLFTYSSRILSIGKINDTARSHFKVYGGGNDDAYITLYCSAGTHGVTIEGPDHTGGTPASYTLKLPNSLPSVANQILESNQTGTLSWIPTPTGSGGISSITGTSPVSITSGSTPVVSMAPASTTASGYLTTTDWNTFNNKADGISFSGATVSGIATFASTSSATVNSEVKLAASGQMTFDGSSGNTGIKFDSGSSTLRVGDIVGNSDIVALYSDGAAKITVSDSDVTVVDTTQFNSGLKFGASGSTLSTYTEATWTSGPTLTFSVGGTATLSASAGSYRVIGDMVFAQFQFTFGSGGYGTANLSLPVSGVAGTGSINFVKMNSNVGNSTVSTPVTGDILTNAASIRLKSFNYDQDSSSHVSGQLFELVDSAGQPIFGNGDVVSGTITYRKS